MCKNSNSSDVVIDDTKTFKDTDHKSDHKPDNKLSYVS